MKPASVGLRRSVGLSVALAALSCLVYLRVLGIGLYCDDYLWLGNMAPTLERPSFLFSVFFRDFNPVVHFTFLIDWVTGHGSAVPLHLTSWLIHGACAFLLGVALQRMGLPRWIVVVVVLSWALNVRLSEAVIWPAARGHSLATLFILLALNGVIRKPRLALLGGAMLLALLSKESALFPLAVLPLFAPSWREARAPAALSVSFGAVFLLFNSLVKPSLYLSREGVGSMLLKTPFIVLRPLGLGDLYPFTPWAAILVLIVAAFVALLLRRRRWSLVGLAWVLVSVVPVVLVPKLSSRYLYLPAIGYALILADLLMMASSRLSSRHGRRLGVVLGGVLFALVASANIIRIQKEITDYGLLSQPYQRCVELLREPVAELGEQEVLVVYDISPRDVHARLSRTIFERGTMTKLVSVVDRGVGHLIPLPTLINILKPRTPHVLGYPEAPEAEGVKRYWVFDGTGVWRAAGPLLDGLPPERVLAARWGAAGRFFETFPGR